MAAVMPTNAEVERAMREALPESLHEEFDALLAERDELEREKIALESKCSHLETDIDGMVGDPAVYDAMESALTTVKYWLHDFFYLKKPAGDPHRILRIVEEALEQ